MQCSQPVQSKDIFTIVPDVMLDDWHLKCIILQDRNLHDDTLAQSRSAKLMQVQRRAVFCATSQHREFYILGNSVKTAGVVVGPMDHLFLITV